MNESKVLKVLLVDDDEDDYILTREYLREIKSTKIDLDWASDYEIAKSEICRFKHDLYLIDYRLGKSSGIDLLKEVSEQGCSNPIIILTGQGESDIDIQALKAGASDYLVKNRIDSYVLEKAIIFAIERNSYKKQLIESQLNYKTLFEELKSKNQIINSILSSLPVVICRLGKGGEIKEMFGSGISSLWINGRENNGTQKYITTDLISENIEKAINTGFTSFIEEKDQDGKKLYFQNYYFHANGEEDIIIFTIDVTNHKETEEAYKEANIRNQELSKVNAMLDHFVYMAAHDLKSPITNLKLTANLIQKYQDINKKLELIEPITISINRLDQIVNGLIEVIEVQKEGEGTPKLVDFQNLFEEVMTDLTGMLENCEGEIIADFSKAPNINYLEAFILSIMMNLLGNSIKYRSQKKLKVKVSTERISGFVILKITDNGLGMDLNKYGQNIFRPFTRFTKQAEGKGIGLHLVKTIVEKNGGTIEVESKPGEGTAFTLFLVEY